MAVSISLLLLLSIEYVTAQLDPTIIKSVACSNGSPCKIFHRLSCPESQYIHVYGAKFGFKANCTSKITDTSCPRSEIERCCTESKSEINSDCYMPVDELSLNFIGEACGNGSSTCLVDGTLIPTGITCEHKRFNSYSIIDYKCKNKGDVNVDNKDNNDNNSDNTDNKDEDNYNTKTIIIACSVAGGIAVLGTVVVVTFCILRKRQS